jgi:hypothetical protein
VHHTEAELLERVAELASGAVWAGDEHAGMDRAELILVFATVLFTCCFLLAGVETLRAYPRCEAFFFRALHFFQHRPWAIV